MLGSVPRTHQAYGLPLHSARFFRAARDTSFYDLLEVKPDASTDEIKKAFRKKAMTLHPDKVSLRIVSRL